MASEIEIQDLYKKFAEKQVLNGVDLTIERGSSLVVIGGSGSGKSVLMKSILGLIKADKGTIKISGQDIVKSTNAERDQIRTRFGMLFQGAALFDSLSIWENVAFGLIQGRNMPRAQAKELALEKLQQVGLGSDIADLSPAELSGGMQKRVGLARAIAADPEIIFFDEPTTGLDPIMADIINDLIVDCVKRLGATTLTITHDMASARKIAHNIAMLYHGRIVWQGAAATIDSSNNPYIEQFINGRARGPIKIEIGD